MKGQNKHSVMLLVTNETPQARVNAHMTTLMNMFGCAWEDITLKWVDATCETPSALVARHGVVLFADSAVGSVAPDSLKLAVDWQTQWSLAQRDAIGAAALLYRCRAKPRK